MVLWQNRVSSLPILMLLEFSDYKIGFNLSEFCMDFAASFINLNLGKWKLLPEFGQ